MIKPILASLFLASVLGSATCAPSSIERGLYNVTTQHVEVVVLRTNISATATNVIAVPAIIEIQRLEPRPEVKEIAQVAGQAATSFGVPWVAPLLGLLWGAYSWWSEMRNKRQEKEKTVLANNVEVGKETILATAGAAVAAQFLEVIKSAQVKAGVKTEIAALVDSKVDKSEARHKAASVVSLAKSNPVPTP